MTSLPTITTLEQLNTLLDRHPYLRDRPNFEKRYLSAQQYLVIKHLQHMGELKGTTLDTLSERTGQDRMTISHWLNDRHKSRLITNIEIHEEARRQYETRLYAEARQHRLDPSTTYQLCKALRDTPTQNFPEVAAEAIEQLLKQSHNPNKVVFTEFRIYHNHGPRWISKIAFPITNHREDIEAHLNTRLGLTRDPNHRISLGVVNHTLYIWHRQTNPDIPLNYYANEAFTFKDPQLKHQLLQDTLKHLNFPDPNRGFLKLIEQITDHPRSATEKMTALYDLRDHGTQRDFILGESLHFLLDATNRNFSSIASKVVHLGRDLRYGIHNPEFHTGATRDELRARLLAIYLSDGHVHRKSSTPEYTEKGKARAEYVLNLLKTTFGDVHVNLRRCGQVYHLNSSTVLGRQLEQWGVMKGAKHLQLFELPLSVKIGSAKIKRVYIEELIPEEGSFIHSKKKRSLVWRRYVVLDAGPKNKEYDFEPKVTQVQKQFIEEYGKKVFHKIGTGEIVQTQLRMKELGHIVNKGRDIYERIIAAQLIEIVEKNRCTLLDDECQLFKNLGINLSCYSEVVYLFNNGRVSTSWVSVVNGQKDILRWAILAPPSSGRKREAVKAWLLTQEKADSMFQKLRAEGLIDQSETKWWK